MYFVFVHVIYAMIEAQVFLDFFLPNFTDQELSILIRLSLISRLLKLPTYSSSYLVLLLT